jgi:integrase
VDRLGLSAAQRELLLKVIKPDSPMNPFRPKFRTRNYAMVILPYTLGLRAGELHGLLRPDYDNSRNPASLMIHRRPHDRHDRRKEPAKTKTRARLLELEGEAQRALDTWLVDRSDRGRFPQARKNSRIFVNLDGEELSLRGARMVFERLRAAYPELAGFCQHVLRHDVNDRLVEQTALRGWDPEEVRADAIYLMGWSEMSKMPERYAKRAIAKRANLRILELQKSDQEEV